MLELPLNVAQQLSSDAPVTSALANNAESGAENPFLNVLTNQISSDDGNSLDTEDENGQLFAAEDGEILPDGEGFAAPIAAMNVIEEVELNVSAEEQLAQLAIEQDLDEDEPNLELTEQELSILAKQIISSPEQSNTKDFDSSEDFDLAAIAKELEQDSTSGSGSSEDMSHEGGDADNIFQSEKMRDSSEVLKTAQVNFKEIKNTTQSEQTKIKTTVTSDGTEVTQVEVNSGGDELVAEPEADIRPKTFSAIKDEINKSLDDEISSEEDATNIISASKSKAANDLMSSSQVDRPLTANQINQVDARTSQHQIVTEEVTNYQVNARVGDENWEPELASKLVMMKTNGVNSAKLQLNPPELGPLDVSLDMATDKLNIVFSSNQPLTRDAIDSAIPKLQQMFSKNEVDVVNVSVTSQNTPDKGDQQSNQNSNQSRKLGVIGKMNQMQNQPEPVAVQVQRNLSHAGVVDYYA